MGLLGIDKTVSKAYDNRQAATDNGLNTQQSTVAQQGAVQAVLGGSIALPGGVNIAPNNKSTSLTALPNSALLNNANVRDVVINDTTATLEAMNKVADVSKTFSNSLTDFLDSQSQTLTQQSQQQQELLSEALQKVSATGEGQTQKMLQWLLLGILGIAALFVWKRKP